MRKAGVRDAGTLAETIAAVRAFVEAPLAAAANGPPRLGRGERAGSGGEPSGRRRIEAFECESERRIALRQVHELLAEHVGAIGVLQRCCFN